MIAVDTNVIVYAHREEMPQHVEAARLLRNLAEGDEPWALPVFVLGEFVRVVTHPRLFSPPSTSDQAVGALEALLGSPTVRLLEPRARFWPLLRDKVQDARATGNLVLDAEIVAVCRERGVSTLLSNDLDFRRFPSLQLRTL
ncbi:MAG TPA: TA system VapC family ribonuclease toxin [Nocardioidaceae bacterium]|nr:TA system VapC family ribonuclease toxin [Nocardioidaceae bacterium]